MDTFRSNLVQIIHTKRYSLGQTKHTTYNPSLACGAALLGSQAFIDADETGAARKLLQEVDNQVSDCPEVALAYARRWKAEADVYRRALSVAPWLAAEALSHDLQRGSVDTIESVSKKVCFGSQGLSAQLKRSRASYEQLTEDLEELGESAHAPGSMPVVQSAREETSNAVLLTSTAIELSDYIRGLAGLVGEVETQLQQWVRTQHNELDPERSKLGQKREILNREQRKHNEAKDARGCFAKTLALFAIPVLIFLAPYIGILTFDDLSQPDGGGANVVGFIWALSGIVSLIGVLVVLIAVWGVLRTSGNLPVSSRERRELEDLQAKIEGLEGEITSKQKEVEEHLRDAKQIINSWPPERVVPFF